MIIITIVFYYRVNFESVVEIKGEKILLQNINQSSHPMRRTASSLSSSSSGDNIMDMVLLPWCGYYINTRTLEIYPNFSRILEVPSEYHVTVEYVKQVCLVVL